MPNPEDAALLGAFGEGIEARRVESERKWGMGRVERLAGMENPDLLARFRRQQVRWSNLYREAWAAPFLSRDLLQGVTDGAASMQRAWVALDAWAEEAGHRPVAPWVWECWLSDGSVVALVEDDAAASKVLAEGRAVSVYTAREVANVIDALPDALKLAKAVWTGAKFTGPDFTRSTGEWVKDGDPIPFPADDPEESVRPFAPVAGKPAAKPARPAPSLALKAPPVVTGSLPTSWEDDFA